MRLWTLHPHYLDAKGLVAAWREALLAQKVLLGATKGYRHHPQLVRFLEQPDPLAVMGAFLIGLEREAQERGYHFDSSKILNTQFSGTITETSGQLLYERDHLMSKLRVRAPQMAHQLQSLILPDPHPLFCIVTGAVRSWEKQ